MKDHKITDLSVSIPCVPVAPSTNVKYTVSLVELFAVIVTFVAVVAVSALPLSCVPLVFTPGKFIFAEPSNDPPPIVLAVCNAVAVAELPVHEPEEPLAFPVISPVISPVNVPAIAPVPVIVGPVKVLFVNVCVEVN